MLNGAQEKNSGRIFYPNARKRVKTTHPAKSARGAHDLFRNAAYYIGSFDTFLPLKGVPASLGPGLRTVSGAKRTARWHLAGRVRLCDARSTSQRQEKSLGIDTSYFSWIAAGSPSKDLPGETFKSRPRLPASRCRHFPDRCVPALAAPPRGQVHQWINAFQPNNRARLCKLVQRPRPSQAGHACSASRSFVTISDLDPASDPGQRALLHRCPGNAERFPSAFTIPPAAPRPRKRGDTETCFAGELDPAGIPS